MKSKQKKIKFKVGDVFLIPSAKAGFYVGQIAADTTSEIGAPFCYIYSKQAVAIDDCKNVELNAYEIISASWITPELIEARQWEICANKPVPLHPAIKKMETLRENGFIGAVVTGGGLVAEYVDTFYGVVNVASWPDPNYVYRFFLIPLAGQTRLNS